MIGMKFPWQSSSLMTISVTLTLLATWSTTSVTFWSRVVAPVACLGRKVYDTGYDEDWHDGRPSSMSGSDCGGSDGGCVGAGVSGSPALPPPGDVPLDVTFPAPSGSSCTSSRS